jgi:hypothetical protein
MKATLIPHFTQVTDEAYYKSPLLSNSAVSAFYAELLGLRGMKAKAATLRTGQLLHLATYQEADFIATAEVTDLKAGGDANIKTLNLVQRMAAAAKHPISGCPVLRSFLNNKLTRYEVPVAALLDKPAVYFKVKPDAALYNRAGTKITYLHDLKSTATTNKTAFLETFTEYGYWRQAFIYMFVTGAKNMFFTGVSKAEPHQIYTVDCKNYKAEIAEAKQQMLSAIETWLEAHPKHLERCQKYLNTLN